MTTPHLNASKRACADLAGTGQPITFTAVADRTGISRTTLYRDPSSAPSSTNTDTTPTTGSTLTGLTDEIATSAPPSKPSPTASATTKNNSAASKAVNPGARPTDPHRPRRSPRPGPRLAG